MFQVFVVCVCVCVCVCERERENLTYLQYVPSISVLCVRWRIRTVSLMCSVFGISVLCVCEIERIVTTFNNYVPGISVFVCV